jgi:hypothetical protein
MLAALKIRPLMGLPLLLMLIEAHATAANVPPSKTWVTPPLRHQAASEIAPHSLSRREIYQAIQNYLQQMGTASRGNLRLEDLRIQSPVPGLKEDAGLEVKKISFDPLRRAVVFELWTSHEPQYLPFTVTTRSDPALWGMPQLLNESTSDAGKESNGETPNSGKAADVTSRKQPVLVKPGRPATLVMQGPNLRVTTTVVPLQPGIKGQTIMVRDATTARVMRAEVVDEGLLQAGL